MGSSKVIDKDLGWSRIYELAKALTVHPYAKVGVLADDAKGGMHEPGGALTLAEIAAVLEYGTEDELIPARPVVRPTFDEQIEHNQKLAAKLFVAMMDGKITIAGALNIMGAGLAAEMKKKITTGPAIPPPNAPGVIARKMGAGGPGGARSLGQAFAKIGAAAQVRTWIDTGRLVNAFTWGLVGAVDVLFHGPKETRAVNEE